MMMMMMMMYVDSHYAIHVEDGGANNVANGEASDVGNSAEYYEGIGAPNDDGSNGADGKRDSINGSCQMTSSLSQSTTSFFVFILMMLIRF